MWQWLHEYIRLYDQGAPFQRGDICTQVKIITRQPSGDRRQDQDRSSPETELYSCPPTPVTSPFLTIFLKMNFLRPTCPLKTCLLFSFTYLLLCMQLRVPWHLYGDQRTNGKSFLFHEGPQYWTQLSGVKPSLGPQDASFTEFFLPPTTLTALWNPGAHDERETWEPPFKHLLGFSADAILLPPCSSVCSNFPFVF